MFPWIIQMSIISLILIILLHYLYTFFQTNLTIPKVKDLVNKPQKQYETLFNTMKENHTTTTEIKNTDPTAKESMKNELKNYLKELSETKKTVPDGQNIMNGNIMTVNDLNSNAFTSNAYSNAYSTF
jgi:hypothetical protein